jgi:glycosyltransferase involved in cell wall biosynthesis
MWDSNGVPTVVIDHGVVDPGYRYTGSLDRALVIINNLPTRGRRLGLDVFEHVRQRVPVDLVGMGSEAIGGLGEVQHRDLPDFMAQYRVFFNPIRYTSLGLAIIESMMVGLPMVGLATTELVSVITPDFNGYISLNPNVLVERIRALLDNPVLAHKLGQNARAYALERFGIPRFAAEWESLFQRLCNQAACSPVVNITA